MKRCRIIGKLFLITAAGSSILTFCGNEYHLKRAAGLLTVKDCLECHNGTVTAPVHICQGRQCLLRGTHSVYSIYPPIRLRKYYATKVEVERAGAVFENGKMTCLSCHDLTKPPPSLIRRGDELCRLCHIRQ